MGEDAQEGKGRIVGREAELTVLRAFLATDRFPRALVLGGGPGAGKSTLWEAGLRVGGELGFRVLAARPSETEARLSHAALADVLAAVEGELLAALPAPQRHALDVALLRAEPGTLPPEPRAVATGVLHTLRAIAARGPVLVAVDDVQWLDAPSADALAFAARRIQGNRVAFIFTERRGNPSALTRALDAWDPERLDVGGLSLGALRLLLADRLGLSLPRRALRRVLEATGGNPLFALEVGRTILDRGRLSSGAEVPVPERVEDLLGVRVAALPGPVRTALAAVALSPDLRVAQLSSIVGPAAVDGAVAAGLLLPEGDRLRPSHPLLAAAARRHVRPIELRHLHRALAGRVTDEPLRARHLALATSGPDPQLAATVAAAASVAAARGAADGAVELAEHALRLTAPDTPEWGDRLLGLAELLTQTGEPQRVTELLAPELERMPHGRARARAHLLLAEESRVSGAAVDAWGEQLDRALAESEGDSGLWALVMARRARYMAVARVEQLPEAEAWGLEALPAARAAGPAVEREVLHGLGWARYLRGRPVDDLRARFHEASPDAYHIFRSLEPLEAERLAGRGDVAGARARFERLLALADERGETWSFVRLRLGLCELELRAGEWDTAERLLDEWAGSPDGELLTAPAYERCRALLAVGRGRPGEALPWAARAIAESTASGLRWDWLEALRVHGTASLLAHDLPGAAGSLREAWAYLEQAGVEDPSVFPVAPELAEALTELGALDDARTVADRLAAFADRLDHPWGRVTAQRCRAMADLASGSGDPEAAATLEATAAEYERFGLRFDAARTLLALGRVERRRRKWGAARRSLEAAVAAFEAIGSPGWAAEARSELVRVGARRPASAGALTAAEARVVELAADGMSNKEIAARLFVAEHTVEAHLGHAYAKLGVASRVELARRIPPGETPAHG